MQNMMDMMTFQVLDNSKNIRKIRARSQKQADARLSNMLMARAAMQKVRAETKKSCNLAKSK